jgi:hypothetical protein
MTNGKLLLSVVAAVTCIGPSDAHVCLLTCEIPLEFCVFEVLCVSCGYLFVYSL